MADDAVLDNGVWHALTGPQAHMAEGDGGALRYPVDASPFAAVGDEPDARDWADLARLVGPGNLAVLFRGEVDVPAGWEPVLAGTAVQMVVSSRGPALAGPDGAKGTDDACEAAGPIDGLAVRRLGAGDVGAMLDLVARTQPGPFLPRTVHLGTYLGVHDGPRLVAMAGERSRPPGWTEISAVCTDPGYRGRGLAGELVRRVAQGIVARGDRPMLHAAEGNDTAIRVYERLGFTFRRNVRFLGLRVPA